MYRLAGGAGLLDSTEVSGINGIAVSQMKDKLKEAENHNCFSRKGSQSPLKQMTRINPTEELNNSIEIRFYSLFASTC